MNKEKIKNIIIVFLLIIIIALCAVIVYKVYTNKSEEINTTIFTEDEFYKTENLVKNGYITKVTSQSDNYIKIENNKVTLKSKDVKNETKTIEISGTPKYAKSIYANSDKGWNTIYFVLTEDGTLYYAELDVVGLGTGGPYTQELPTNFIKVTDKKVLNIYTYNTSKENIFPYEALTIYAELENNDLVEVKGSYYEPYNDADPIVYLYKGLGRTFKENYYFVDIIMTEYDYLYSASSHYLISWDKKLYDNPYQENDKYNSTELKYNNKSVTIEDGFTTYKDNDEDTNDYDIYVISTDKYLYQVDKDNLKLERVSDKKIINSKYINNDKKDENKGYSKYERYYEITFEDNNIQKYNIINVSTLNKA